MEKAFQRFQALSLFARKIFFLKAIFHGPENSIQAFDRLQKSFLGNSIICRELLKNWKACLPFLENSFVFVHQMWHYKALNQYSMAQKIRFRLLTNFKRNLSETPIQRESFWRVTRFALFSQKKFFVFMDKIWHCKTLNQCSLAHKIRLSLLTDFKTNFQETSV